MSDRNFFAELKRRNVYKVAVAYILSGWALSQGIGQVFPMTRSRSGELPVGEALVMGMGFV